MLFNLSLAHWLVVLSVFVSIAGGTAYIRDTLNWEIQTKPCFLRHVGTRTTRRSWRSPCRTCRPMDGHPNFSRGIYAPIGVSRFFCKQAKLLEIKLVRLCMRYLLHCCFYTVGNCGFSSRGNTSRSNRRWLRHAPYHIQSVEISRN